MAPLSKHVCIAFALAVSAASLSACGSQFTTGYSESAPAEAKDQWRVAKINVVVPDDLITSEVNSYMPAADIVWHGDEPGDRRAQVAEIVGAGIRQGVGLLQGPQDVLVTATLRRFHSLTPKAYHAAPSGTGVHSVIFDLLISDPRTGEILAGPEQIKADMPALVMVDDPAASTRQPGARWKAGIESHIAATLRSWLGTGPDIRGSFTRLGT